MSSRTALSDPVGLSAQKRDPDSCPWREAIPYRNYLLLPEEEWKGKMGRREEIRRIGNRRKRGTRSRMMGQIWGMECVKGHL